MATIHSCGSQQCKGCGLAAPVMSDFWPSCFGKLSYQCSTVFSVATGITKFKQAELNVTRPQKQTHPCITLVQPQQCIVAIDLNGRMRISHILEALTALFPSQWTNLSFLSTSLRTLYELYPSFNSILHGFWINFLSGGNDLLSFQKSRKLIRTGIIIRKIEQGGLPW